MDYTIQKNAVCFLPGDRLPTNTAGKGFLSRVQESIKQNGKLYYFLRDIFAPVLMSNKYNNRLKSLLKKYNNKSIIINMGSGPQYFKNRRDIINIDVFAFDEVDIVADVTGLPICDNSVDFILNIAMIEHVEEPEKVIQEAYRILKPGGIFFGYLPFMAPYHAAPNDFYRWTKPGIKKLFYGFKSIEIDIGAGPTSGMLWVLQEWLAIFFSFGSRTMHDIIFMFMMVLTAPIKLADILLVHFPNAEKIASGFLITGKK